MKGKLSRETRLIGFAPSHSELKYLPIGCTYQACMVIRMDHKGAAKNQYLHSKSVFCLMNEIFFYLC